MYWQWVSPLVSSFLVLCQFSGFYRNFFQFSPCFSQVFRLLSPGFSNIIVHQVSLDLLNSRGGRDVGPPTPKQSKIDLGSAAFFSMTFRPKPPRWRLSVRYSSYHLQALDKLSSLKTMDYRRHFVFLLARILSPWPWKSDSLTRQIEVVLSVFLSSSRLRSLMAFGSSLLGKILANEPILNQSAESYHENTCCKYKYLIILNKSIFVLILFGVMGLLRGIRAFIINSRLIMFSEEK